MPDPIRVGDFWLNEPSGKVWFVQEYHEGDVFPFLVVECESKFPHAIKNPRRDEWVSREGLWTYWMGQRTSADLTKLLRQL